MEFLDRETQLAGVAKAETGSYGSVTGTARAAGSRIVRLVRCVKKVLDRLLEGTIRHVTIST